MFTIDALRALYAAQPESREQFNCSRDMNLEDALKRAEKKAPASFSLPSLRKSRNEYLDELIIHLNHGSVYDALGHDALLYAWVNYPLQPRDDAKIVLGQRTGTDPGVLEKARLAAWQLDSSFMDNAQTVLTNINLIKYLRSGALGGIDLKGILMNNPGKGVTLSEKRLDGYTLEALSTPKDYVHRWAEEYTEAKLPNGKLCSIYLDTPIAFCLSYKGIPNAVASMIFTEKGALRIQQLQGVKTYTKDSGALTEFSSRGLAPLDWEAAMVRIAEDIAKGNSIGIAGIQGGNNNKWTREKYHDTGKPHLELEAALKRYDGTARRLGYRQRKDKNWYRRLE